MISIRPFEERDAPALTAIMLEMAGFYGATIQDGRNVEAEVLANAGHSDTLLALRDGEMLAGFATFATLFPVGALVAFTYVQQVYVASSARRLGIAQQLMAAVARMAKDRGHVRIEWATSVENSAARALYDGLGATGTHKVQYVLEGAAMDQLADMNG